MEKKRCFLFLFFLAILMLFLNFNVNTTVISQFGNFLLSFVLAFLGTLYLKMNHKEIYCSFEKISLLVAVCTMSLIISKGVEFASHYQIEFLDMQYPLFVPFASILICLLLGSEVALFSSFFLTLILGTFLDVSHMRFMILNFAASVIAILGARDMYKQKQIFGISAKVWISSMTILLAFHLIDGTFATPSLFDGFMFSFVFMLATALLVLAFLPVLEYCFNVITNMTLMEFADPSNPLLRRLSLEAPGTYQHSLVVGNLAENAARAVHANGLFCRISTLYHDVGKLFNPHYFNENQLGGLNIHQLLTPKESAQVIISHVREGEILARKYHLPKSFIDIIKEHHGTSKVKHFYNKQADADVADFSYFGPKPKSKESAIIMIADKVEAASRSLLEITEESIAQMVESIICEKIQEGQLDDCKLTFEELGIVKKEIIKTLVVARHLRIKNP